MYMYVYNLKYLLPPSSRANRAFRWTTTIIRLESGKWIMCMYSWEIGGNARPQLFHHPPLCFNVSKECDSRRFSPEKSSRHAGKPISPNFSPDKTQKTWLLTSVWLHHFTITVQVLAAYTRTSEISTNSIFVTAITATYTTFFFLLLGLITQVDFPDF